MHLGQAHAQRGREVGDTMKDHEAFSTETAGLIDVHNDGDVETALHRRRA